MQAQPAMVGLPRAGEDREMDDDIVISDRAGARVLALLPVVVVGLAARVLTWTTPPLAVRMVAAGVVAGACWVAYRLLTARLVVRDGGLHIRGVLGDVDLTWGQIAAVDVGPASRVVRFLFGAALPAQTLLLEVAGRKLRPVACLSHPEDDELRRALGAVRVRTGAWSVPPQRTASGTTSRVGGVR
jgi:hypothetical protein